jgi:hypothetical protein
VLASLLDHIAAGPLTRPECGADDESTPSGATGARVGISMFFVTLVGHTLARPTRWSTWSFFHVMSNRLSAYIESSKPSLVFGNLLSVY